MTGRTARSLSDERHFGTIRYRVSAFRYCRGTGGAVGPAAEVAGPEPLNPIRERGQPGRYGEELRQPEERPARSRSVSAIREMNSLGR